MPQCNECGKELKYDGICKLCKSRLTEKRLEGPLICCRCQDPDMRAKKFKFFDEDKKAYWQAWCFDCWEAKSLKGVYCKPKIYKTKEEAEYARLIVECYRKPKFYGDEPDMKAIEKAHMAVMMKKGSH